MDGGSSLRIALIVSAEVGRWNVCLPITISYKMAPSAKMSARWSVGWPRTCSGDMYPIVPSATPGNVIVAARFADPLGWITLANPKSRIFTRPSLVTNRLSGLRSR